MTAPAGGGFGLTGAALKQAEDEFNLAAREVLRQFKQLEDAVLENPSVGAAFTAAQRVATELTGQAQKFQRLTEQLAANIHVSSLRYDANSAAGAQAMNSVAGMIDGGGEAGTGGSFDRLVRG